MLRDEPSIRARIYHLPRDPLVSEILVPAMRQSVCVRGAFGWFSAGWIPYLAPGLAEFLTRPDSDRLKMVVSPALFPEELEVLTSVVESREVAMVAFSRILEEAGGINEDVLARHALECLAWLFASGRLELRIAVPKPGSNYHPKIWEFSDDSGDVITVLGSANATSRAFLAAEHMQVECSWDRPLNVETAERMIDGWWAGDDDALQETIPLSKAVEQQLLAVTPETAPTQQDFQDAWNMEIWKMTLSSETSSGPVFRIPPELKWQTGKYSHQGEAVIAWEAAGRRGILEMATGAGKTISALISAYRTSQVHQGPLFVMISAPTGALVSQWDSECRRFGLEPVIPVEFRGVNRRVAISHIFDRLRNAGDGHVEAMIVSNSLLRMGDFQDAIKREAIMTPALGLLHIGDEAHGLGAEGFISNPPDFFEYRLGLSATPDRQYDDDGTVKLKEYFGETVYEFGLDRAIGFCLVPYDYFIHVVHLDIEELDEYRRLTAVAMAALSRGDEEAQRNALIKRRSVIESTGSKIPALETILRGQRPRHLLVYTSAKNPEQLPMAKNILDQLGIDSAVVTEEQSKNPELLKSILDSFAEGDIDALIAKKVLDEGVDIPATREAVLVASSTVAREWIQRRGRVLRMAPGKDFAVIHDIVAVPPPTLDFDSGTFSIVRSECDRVREFAKYARNANDVFGQVEELLNGYQ